MRTFDEKKFRSVPDAGDVQEAIAEAMRMFLGVAEEQGFVLPYQVHVTDADGDTVLLARLEPSADGNALNCIDLKPMSDVSKLAICPVIVKLSDNEGRKMQAEVTLKPPEGHAA